MALKSTFVAVAAVGGALLIGASPCHAQPGGGTAPAQKRITLAFSNAPVTDVMERLRGQGINFVLAERNVPTDSRITLNLTDQPEAEAMYALGEALGGHWERRGDVYLFRKGPAPGVTGIHGDVVQADDTARPPVRAAIKPEPARPATPSRRTVSPSERILVSYTQTAPIGSRMRTFLDSLTSAQRATHAKKGFLLLGELTIRQRKLLGGMDAVRGRLDIRLSGDEESITIKSDPPAKDTKKSTPKRPARRRG